MMIRRRYTVVLFLVPGRRGAFDSGTRDHAIRSGRYLNLLMRVVGQKKRAEGNENL